MALCRSGAKAAGHAEHRQGDNGDSRNLEAVQPPRAQHALEADKTVGEQDQGQGRWQCEPGPRSQSPHVSGARQTDCQSDLAAGRPGQELTQGNEIRVGSLLQPAPAHHELVVKISKVRHRAAEGGQAELEEDKQDFGWAAFRNAWLGHGTLHSTLPCVTFLRADT